MDVVATYTEKEFREISSDTCRACGEFTSKLNTQCTGCGMCRLCGEPRDGSKENNIYHHYVLDVEQYGITN